MNKKYFLLLISLLYFINFRISAQERAIDIRFKGGEEAFIRHMSENLKYSTESLDKNIIGYSITSITITADGTIKDVKTVNSLDNAIDTQVSAAILKTQGKWLKSDSIKTDQNFYVQVIYQNIKLGENPVTNLNLKDIYNFLEPVYITAMNIKESPNRKSSEAIAAEITEDMKANKLEEALKSADELIRRNPFVPALYQLRIAINSRLKNSEMVNRDTQTLQNFLPGVTLNDFINTYAKEQERLISTERKVTEINKDMGEIVEISNKMEQKPKFPGGERAMMNFIMHNLEYPVLASERNIQGMVIVRFVVQKDGSISNAQVIKSVDPSCDAEALRVISRMPKWKPAIQDGKPVNTYFTIPFRFVINR